MVEPLIGRSGCRVHACVRLRDEDVGAAELEVDARLALLRGSQDLRPEHALVIARRRLRVGAAQMDVVVGEFRHGGSPLLASVPGPVLAEVQAAFGRRSWRQRTPTRSVGYAR